MFYKSILILQKLHILQKVEQLRALMIHLKSQYKTNHHNPLKKHTKQQPIFETIPNIYQHYITADSRKIQTKNLITLIKLCYKHHHNQQQLIKILKVPWVKGPITINNFPAVLLHQMQQNHKQNQEENQLYFLIQFLKSVKQSYFCWIIYFNQQQKQLKLKLLRKDEVEENENLFNAQLNLIGIFINGAKKLIEVTDNNVLEQQYTSADKKEILKSNASFNNSTNVTWKNMSKSKDIFKDHKHNEKSLSKIKIKSFSPKLRINNKKSSNKLYEQNPYKKSFSISVSIKSKSKSHTSLPARRIKREPVEAPSNFTPPILKQNKTKSKLKKETKIHKIGSVYFKKPWKRCQN